MEDGLSPDEEAKKLMDRMLYACEMDNVEEVKNCIADGIDINELHYHEFNYLTDAACHNSLAALQFLIDSGADVNYKHHDGTSPIYYAKIYNRPEAIEILYRAGSKL